MRNIFEKYWGAVVAMLTAMIAVDADAAALTFQLERPGCPAVAVEPQRSSGLEMVYVVRNDGDLQAHFTMGDASASIGWQRFAHNGSGSFYFEDVPFSRNGADTWIRVSTDDMGYIVTEGDRRYCFWIVNYNNHELELGTLDIAPEQDCDRVALLFGGDADKIQYYTLNNRPVIISRELELTYNTMNYDEERAEYVEGQAKESLESAEGTIRVDAPLVSTDFELSGDRFLRAWGEWQSVVSPEMPVMAIAATTTATQRLRDIDNEQKEDGAALGGSGPVEVEFHAATTEGVVYREWQFSFDKAFDMIDLRIQENDVTHTFDNFGTTYVRFVAGNNSGSCNYTGEIYEVYIGESRLECPNAFSPGSTEGTNDEWKVSYKSITEFDCHIFNRWGLEMSHFTDPSQGWDGKYKGKLVPAGVYYYVIKARGTDGREYKLSGDINIIRYKQGNGTNGYQQ